MINWDDNNWHVLNFLNIISGVLSILLCFNWSHWNVAVLGCVVLKTM